MNNKTLGIVLLVVAILLALMTGFIDLDSTLRIILYIVAAALAIWAILQLMRKVDNSSHHGSRV